MNKISEKNSFDYFTLRPGLLQTADITRKGPGYYQQSISSSCHKANLCKQKGFQRCPSVTATLGVYFSIKLYNADTDDNDE